MKRSTGLFLLVFGVIFLLVGGACIIASIDDGAQLRVLIGLCVIFLVFGGLLTVYGVRIMRGNQPAGEPPTPVDGRVGNYRADAVETRERGGQDYEVHYQQPVRGKNGRQSSLIIRMPATTPVAIQFNEENGFDRWCKRMGIAREHQTNDAEFDRAIYIRCASHAFADEYLKDQHKREAILRLRKLGFQTIKLTGRHAEVEWKRFDPNVHDQPDLTDHAVDELRALAHEAPQVDQEGIAARADPRIMRLGLLWCIAIALALTFIAVFVYTPIHESSLIIAGLFVFVVVYPIYAWLAAFLIRGTSTAHDDWAKLLTAGVLLLGLGSFGTVALLNGATDDSQAEDRTSVVIDKRIKTGKRNSKTYYVKVNDWNNAANTLEFRVTSSEYGTIAVGQSKLELIVHRGAFGIEWLETKQVKR